jgi:hypothetical protein
MKQLLFLFLFLLPCLAWAQYPSNGNQKITLGEQTTADGLIWRGRVTDTTLTVKSDTAAYFVLDTVNLNLYTYKASATGKKWIQLGSDTTSLNLVSRFAAKLNISDTVSMLTNYYRSGRTGIIQASDVPTLNQNTTGSAATLTTSRTFQTNLASTSTASFNGSANVTPGVTGTLPVANGGTGSATQNFVDLTNTQTVNGEKTFTGGATFNSSISLSNNQNGNTAIGIFNTTAGANSASYYIFSTDINSGNGLFGKYSLTTTPYKIIGASNTFLYNGTIAGDLAIFNDYANGSIKLAAGGSSSAHLTITSTGAATFGSSVTATDLRLTNLTNVTDLRTDADGDLFNGSDFNLKNSIDTINYGLKDVLKLKPVQFNWNDVNRNLNEYKNLGFIAQDVMDVIPNAASSMGDGDMQVDYNAIVATLTKAIQEQNLLIKALEQRIINLENK